MVLKSRKTSNQSGSRSVRIAPRRRGGLTSPVSSMPAFLTNLLVFGRLLRAAGRHTGWCHARRHRGVARRRRQSRRRLSHLPRDSRGAASWLQTFDTVFEAFWREQQSFAGREAANLATRIRRRRQSRLRQCSPAIPIRLAIPTRERSRGSSTWSESALWGARTSPSSHRRKRLRHASQSSVSSGCPANAGHADGFAAEALSTCGGRLRARVRTRATLSTFPPDAARSGRAVWSCCATSADRWSGMRACCFTSRMASVSSRGASKRFLFSTSLTRVTRQLRLRNVNRAAVAVSDACSHWSGGTRIGHALQEFRRLWSRRVMREGPVVLLISDGGTAEIRPAPSAGEPSAQLPPPDLAESAHRHIRPSP